MFVRTFVIMAFTLMQLANATAQEPRGEFLGKDFSDSVRASLEEYASTCPTFETDACSYGKPMNPESCQVVGLDSLGSAGGADYFFARYLSTAEFSDEVEGSWKCEADRAILLETPVNTSSPSGSENHFEAGARQALPVWRDAAERTFWFIRNATLTDHEGTPLLSILYCLNGTGGCWDYLLIRDGPHWRPLEKDSTWDLVYAQLPGGYRTHKSPAIDIEHLKWEQHIASQNDANCCPSGRLLLDLDIVEGKLSVKRARLEADLSLDPR